MKTVLLVGEWYSTNLGDGVICNVVENYLKKDFSIERFDLSGKDQYAPFVPFQRFSPIRQTKCFIIYEIKHALSLKSHIHSQFNPDQDTGKRLKKYKIPDAIVFAGGQLLMEHFFSRLYAIILYAEENNIPVYFNACGYSHRGGADEDNKIFRILNSDMVKYISVRDGFNMVTNLSSQRVINTVDPAVASRKCFQYQSKSKKLVGLGIMFSPYHSLLIQIKFWKKLISECQSSNIHWCLFCNGAPEDESFAKYILDQCHLPYEDYFMMRPQTPEELIKQIAKFDRVISMRLHSLIIACSLDIPTIAISWNGKVNEFYQKIDRLNFCYSLKTSPSLIVRQLGCMKGGCFISEAMISEVEENIAHIKKMILK